MPAPLKDTYDKFLAHTYVLLQEFDTPLPKDRRAYERCEPVHHSGRAYLLIRLQHLWGEFCRVIVTRSAVGGCARLGGGIIAPAPRIVSVHNVETIIGRTYVGPGSQWDVPKWAVAKASTLNIANYNEVSLGLSSAPASEVTAVRNYLVHPNIRTRAEFSLVANRLGVPGLSSDDLLRKKYAGGASQLETWIDLYRIAASNAIK